MKPLSEIYNELGIAFDFPINITDEWGDETYFEDSDGRWKKWEYDAKGYPTYYENSNGFWYKCEYNAKGDETYYENSNGLKQGKPKSAKTCEGKVV